MARHHTGTLDASVHLSTGPSLLTSRPHVVLMATDHRLDWATKALPEGAADHSQLQIAALGGGLSLLCAWMPKALAQKCRRAVDRGAGWADHAWPGTDREAGASLTAQPRPLLLS